MFSAATAFAKPLPKPFPELKFLAASAVSSNALETILTDQAVKFMSPTHNLKLSAIFASPLNVSSVHLESCEKDWADGIHVFASPGRQHVFVEGGKKKFDANLKSPVESVSVVFGKDSDLCLKNLKFFDSKNQAIVLKVFETSRAEISDEVLFDQHPETIKALEEPVNITFAEPKTFDRLIVWTGGSPFYAHSLQLKGEKGWSETLSLRDSASDQEVVFRKPFTGTKLIIEAPDAGELGEIRFAHKTKVEGPRSLVSTAKSFEDAGMPRLLDFEWVSSDGDADKWKIIFRQNGSFFVRGFSDDTRQARDYSAMGAYQIVRADQNKIRVKLNGVKIPTGFPWDGVSCPFMCGSESHGEGFSMLTDTLLIEKLDEGSVIVRNRTPFTQRTLSLSDVKVRRAVDD